MPYKNDDLEKLFRKAARHYPLKTDNADWDEVANKLENSKKINSKKINRTYGIIFFGFIIIGSLSINKLLISSKQKTNKETANLNLAPVTGKPNMHEATKQVVVVPGKNKERDVKNTYLIQSSIPLAKNNKFITDNAFMGIVMDKNSDANKNTDKNEVINFKEIALENENASITNMPQQTEIEGTKINSENKSVHVNIKVKPRIYGVAYGGLEFSTVKSQRATTPGYRLGVALGYNINDWVSIELGLQREHVNFYSDGKYVDTSLLRIRRNTDVEKASASSKVTSVPLTVRYRFAPKNNGYFFASVGVNALIITHSEKYNYAIAKNGVESNLSKKYNAVTNPKYFSGFNISAGYQTKLFNNWSVKIEPYYQAPVQNFGVGKLPVSNFGVDFGIVKNLK